MVIKYGKRERSIFWANLFGVTVHQVHSFFNHHKDLKAKYLEPRHNRSDVIKDYIERDGGKRTFKEWAKEIGYKAYDISNAVAKYPHLQPRIILERNRSYHKFPAEWDKFIIENSGKYTCSELDKIFGVKEGTVNSHVNPKRGGGLREHVRYHSDVRVERLLDKFSKIVEDLPLPKSAVIEKVGYLSSSDYKHIKKRFGLEKSHIYTRPKIEIILKTIAEHPHQETMTHWAELFDVDLSHISRMVHNHQLLHKIKPHKSSKNYDEYKSVNTKKRHSIEEIELNGW